MIVGANLPWIQYGCDFGSNAWQPDGGVSRVEQRRRLSNAFARMAEGGLTTVRWFMLCDGRAGIRWDASGRPLGLDEAFWRDLEAGTEEAARAGVSLVFNLLDFTFWRPAHVVGGVRCGGHRRAGGRDPLPLVDRVVVPILRRCRREPAVVAWDVVNEPEWVTLGWGGLAPWAAVRPKTMRRFVGDVVAAVHAETGHAATVGLATRRGLGLIGGLGLDFFQVHWYDRHERRASLEWDAAGLDRPVWLGEYPTAGSERSADEILTAARRSGYAAALAWSAEAVDESSARAGRG